MAQQHFRAVWNQGERNLDHLTAFSVAGPKVEFIGLREAGGALRGAFARAESEDDVRLVLSAIAGSVVDVAPVHLNEWDSQMTRERNGIHPLL